MLETKAFQDTFSLLVPQPLEEHGELDRLLAAAVVSPRFCRLLLEDPARALEEGYQGEEFLLSDQELALFQSIRADSLADFADQLTLFFDVRPKTPALIPVPALEFAGR